MRQPLSPQQESASSEKPPKTLKSDSSFVFFGVVREKLLLFRLYFEASSLARFRSLQASGFSSDS